MFLLVLLILLMVFVLAVNLEIGKMPDIYEFEDEKGLYYSTEESAETNASGKAA